MLVLSSCKSYQKEESKEINNFIPAFPSPMLDDVPIVEFERNDKQEVEFVKMPYWYWLEIVSYASEVEAFAQSF